MAEVKRCNDLSGKEWLQNSFSIWRGLTKTKEEKDLKHPASFPTSLCEKVIKTFSRSDSVILDPFNGIGTTMVACQNLGHLGVGIDLSDDYCEIARSRVKESSGISIVNGNATVELPMFPSDYFDLCLTSPPYWDILNMRRTADIKASVNYSDNHEDLGNIGDYSQFLYQLKAVFVEVFRVLRKGSYCIVNVMDIRKKDKFYPLHSDLATELKNCGFIYDDLIIWDRQADYNNMRPLGYPSRFRINKIHEYLLVFLK